MSINKQAVIDSILLGFGDPAFSFIPMPSPWYTEEGVPQYGGVITIAEDIDVRTFDDTYPPWTFNNYSLGTTNEELFEGDWIAGPVDRNEVTWLMPGGYDGQERFAVPQLAESWDINLDNNTITYHIRKGVYYHNKPPANGRELVAADVAFCIDRQWTTEPKPFLGFSYPAPKSIMSVVKIILTADCTVKDTFP